MSTAPDYTSVAARAVARDIMVTPTAVAEIAEMLGGADGYAVASRAADLVSKHAARLGMDAFAAGLLTGAILALPEALVAERAGATHG